MYSKQPAFLPEGFIPDETDILCGRGKANAKHPGNVLFMTIIKSSLPVYTSAPSRMEKTVVVTSIVNDFLKAGIRFLKVDTKLNRHFELSFEGIHEKVGHAIRDLLKNNKQNRNCSASKTITRPVREKKIDSDFIDYIRGCKYTGKKRPFSSAFTQEQELMTSITEVLSVTRTTPLVLESSSSTRSREMRNESRNFSEKFLCGKKNKDIRGIITLDDRSVDFPLTPHANAAGDSSSPLPLHSKLDLESLDIDALSSILSI